MTKLPYLILGSMLLLIGCTERTGEQQGVAFAEFSTPAPISKAYGTTWSQGDRIGIFMLSSEADFTPKNIIAEVSNIPHAAHSSGTFCIFTPIDPSQMIKMPSDNSSVDFCAYYPYTEVVYSGFNIPVDVQDQSNLEAIDFMVAKRVVGKSQNDNKVLFSFDHVLSLLEITLEGGFGVTGSELEELNVTVCNSKSYGSLSIAQNTVSARNIGDIVTQKAGTDHTIEAIVIPQQFSPNNYPYLQVIHRGITYNIPLVFNFIRAKRHQLTLMVEDKRLYLTPQNVVIKSWETGTGGSYEFDHKAVADGTQELDPTLFTLDNPHWVVRGMAGGNANQNYLVTQNIRKALAALPTNGSANGTIVLEIEHLTALPSFGTSGAEKGAFEGCLQLKEVVLSSSLKTLDSKAFAGCSNLQKITAMGVTQTAESTFEQCAALVQAELPRVQTMGNASFKGCTSLETITVAQLAELSVELFADCSSLKYLAAPRATKLYERAVSGCIALAALNLTASGELKMLINPFSDFTNSQNCVLTLHADKQSGGAGTPLVTGDGKWGASTKEMAWKQIKFE